MQANFCEKLVKLVPKMRQYKLPRNLKNVLTFTPLLVNTPHPLEYGQYCHEDILVVASTARRGHGGGGGG